MEIANAAGINRISPMRTGHWVRAGAKDPAAAQAQDVLHISTEARQALAQEQEASPIEKALEAVAQEDVQAWMGDWQARHRLEVNWNATVDPDHSVYAKSYMESLVRQYDSVRQTIEAYYAEGHQENLRFANPYNHLVEKYRYSASPYFKADMTEAQRQMAFRQEEALLWGGRLALNDPWALAGSGGVLDGQKVDDTARTYAQSVVDGLIAEYKKANGIEEY